MMRQFSGGIFRVRQNSVGICPCQINASSLSCSNHRCRSEWQTKHMGVRSHLLLTGWVTRRHARVFLPCRHISSLSLSTCTQLSMTSKLVTGRRRKREKPHNISFENNTRQRKNDILLSVCLTVLPTTRTIDVVSTHWYNNILRSVTQYGQFILTKRSSAHSG